MTRRGRVHAPELEAGAEPGDPGAPRERDSGVDLRRLGRQPRRLRLPRATPPVGLYVHVPFCVSICPYCDFVVMAGADARGARNRIDAFVAALLAEISLRAEGADRAFGEPGAGGRPRLRSVYLGGGTPTLLPAEAIARLLDLVADRFGLEPGAEITIESNPGPAERGDARALRDAGITRWSIGAQRLERDGLRALGRRHAPEDVGDAIAEVRSAGVPSVSLDLLYDIPGDSIAAWGETLERALELGPDHLSLYALTLEDPDADGLTGPTGDHLPMRAGARRWREAARRMQDEDRAAAMYHLAVVRLSETGFEGYEISNWARPGHASRHNRAYWERLPYEAVGPGAHAFDGAARRWNAARLGPWLASLTPVDGSAARLPPGDKVTLSEQDAAAEAAILGLRTARGVAAATADEPPLDAVVGWALGHELVTRTSDDRIVLTTRGRLLSNELFARMV